MTIGAMIRLSPHFAIDAVEYASRANAILGIRDSGKALALDTPLPTPSGWTTMGDVRVGDDVFDEKGQPCCVLETKEVLYGRECFMVTFSDGSKVVADGDHLWLTETYKSRTADRNAEKKGAKQRGRGGRHQCERQSFPALITTRQINETLLSGTGQYHERNHAIRNCAALDCPTATLPISPYVLGCWLGDGTSQNATFTTADHDVLSVIRAEGYEIGQPFNKSKSGKSATYRIQRCPDGMKLHTKLREASLLLNKHVPVSYLRASRRQRADLLAGLMDTDGTVQRGSNSCIFYNMNADLAYAVYELVCSLGWSATITTKRARLNGRDYGECFQIRFRPTEQIFRLPRKAAMLDFSVSHEVRRIRRMIVTVERTPSVPVRCIKVSSDSHLFLCGRSMIPTHNTYTGTLIAEQLFDAGIPFFAFDPIGRWRFLKVPGKDGKGFPIVVAGGTTPDLPLTPENAPELVRAAMRSNVSMVIDLYSIGLSKAAWRAIVRNSIDTILYEGDGHGQRHVFLEEAAEFIPQHVRDGNTYAAVEKLARMGGNVGVGVTLINQRAEEVNKAVLELCDNLLLHRQRGKNSLLSLRKWLEAGNVNPPKEITDTLADLPTGQCWAWFKDVGKPKLIKIARKRSFDPDRRAMAANRAGGKGPPASIDVSTFVARMKAALAGKPAAPLTLATEGAIKKNMNPPPTAPRSAAMKAQVAPPPPIKPKQEAQVDEKEARALRDENSELKRKLARLEGKASRSESQVASPMNGEQLDMDAIYAEVKRRAANDPGILRLLTEKPKIDITVERKSIEIDGSSLKGRLANMIAIGFFNEGRTQSGTRSELKRTGPDVNQGNLWKTLAALVADGFLTLESGKEYRAVEGMKINIVEK